MSWHLLDVRAIWIREFALALSRVVETRCWLPDLSWDAWWRTDGERVDTVDPGLRVRTFPLQRGFARPPVSWLAREDRRLERRLLRAGAPDDVLVLTTPHYWRLAGQWKGPVVYYATDMFRFYGQGRYWIEEMEEAICGAATLVCPNSWRIARYFVDELEVPRRKIDVLPMATRACNILPACPTGPAALPPDIADLPRPVAGVIGNLSTNMDWALLRQVIEETPWLSWLFVGPTNMPAGGPRDEALRRSLQMRGGRVRFAGYRPYGELAAYARAVDVAVLPYQKVEPTYSGSSTRFYEHLAACRPMIATKGFEELLHKEPLVRLADDAAALTAALNELRFRGFQDGQEELRWRTSHGETWEARAAQMCRKVESHAASVS